MEVVDPPQESGRVEVVDAIRGFALMGLFLVHMVEYFELYWYAPEPGWVHDLVFGLFAGKAYALFALMFGFSCYVLIEAPASRASLSHGRYAWRLILLWGFGYVHSLVYAGDILQLLAVAGFITLAIHHIPDRVMLALAAVFLLQVPFFVQYALLLPDPSYTQPMFWQAFGANFEIFANADLANLLKYNSWHGQFAKWILSYETGALWNFLGLFFVGILLGRRQLFGNRISSRAYVMSAAVLGVIALSTVVLRYHFGPGFQLSMHRWVFEEGLGRIYNFCIVGVYLTLIVALYRSRIGRYLLKPLLACGRASLSLYVLQSLVFVPLFYGFGLGWHKSIGQEGALALGVLAWVAQMILANKWLERFRYAPFEALWRHLSRFGLNRGEQMHSQREL